MRRMALALCIGMAIYASGTTLADKTSLRPTRIERTGKPNDFLVCPPERCRAQSDQPAPVFAIPAKDLFTIWLDVIRSAPRTTIVSQDEDTGVIHAEQRSRIFGFIDTVVIETFALAGGSTFAAYSRSETGYYDFGVNRRRLEDWVARLADRVAKQD